MGAWGGEARGAPSRWACRVLLPWRAVEGGVNLLPERQVWSPSPQYVRMSGGRVECNCETNTTGV